ncbi:hypothetical protein ACVLVH_003421 [Kluyvera sp. 1366]
MNPVITIRIPSATVSTLEFARLEGYAVDTFRKMTQRGQLEAEPKRLQPGKKRVGGKTRILYARYKEKQVRANLGHSRFEIVIG